MIRKSFLLMIALILLLPCAFAQQSGNLNNGGFVLTEGENVYVADPEGLWLLSPSSSPILIEEGPVSMVQAYEGRIYYLKDLYGEDLYGFTSLIDQTPMSCLPDGSDKRQIGQSRAVGSRFDYTGENGEVMEMDVFIGYQNFTVYDGYIYYLSNSGIPGEYVCTGEYGNGEGTLSITGKYESGIALFRSDLNGENTIRLTGAIGNSIAGMAIENDRIYLASGYQDTIYAYNYVNYAILSLDGEVRYAFTNTLKNPENHLKSDAGEFYHITNAVLPCGDDMLVSLADSEGDFVASQLFRLDKDGNLTKIAIEQQYVPSVLSDDKIYYVGSASRTTFYDDSLNYADSFGIYVKGADEEGAGVKLCPIRYDGFAFNLRIAVSGEYVYFKGETGEVFRAHRETGETEKFTQSGFIKASAIER